MKPKGKSSFLFVCLFVPQEIGKREEDSWLRQNHNTLAFRILFVVRFLQEMVYKYNVEERMWEDFEAP